MALAIQVESERAARLSDAPGVRASVSHWFARDQGNRSFVCGLGLVATASSSAVLEVDASPHGSMVTLQRLASLQLSAAEASAGRPRVCTLGSGVRAGMGRAGAPGTARSLPAGRRGADRSDVRGRGVAPNRG